MDNEKTKSNGNDPANVKKVSGNLKWERVEIHGVSVQISQDISDSVAQWKEKSSER